MDLRTKLKETASRTLGLSAMHHVRSSNDAGECVESAQTPRRSIIRNGQTWIVEGTRLAA